MKREIDETVFDDAGPAPDQSSTTTLRRPTMSKYTLDKGNRILRDGEPTGYSVGRGSYIGTSDNKVGRWYIECDTGLVNRPGRGYATKKAALVGLLLIIATLAML